MPLDPRLFPGIQLGLTGLSLARAALSSAVAVTAGSVFGLVTEIPKLISQLVPADPRAQFGAARSIPLGNLIAGLPSPGAQAIEDILPFIQPAGGRRQRLTPSPQTFLGFNVQSLFSVNPAQVAIGEAGVERFLEAPLPVVEQAIRGPGRLAVAVIAASKGISSQEFLQANADTAEIERRPKILAEQVRSQIKVLERDPLFVNILSQTELGRIQGAEVSEFASQAFGIPTTEEAQATRAALAAQFVPVIHPHPFAAGIATTPIPLGVPQPGPAVPAPFTPRQPIGVTMPEVSTSSGGLGAFGGFVEGLGQLVQAVSPIISPIIAANFPGQQPIALPGGAQIPGRFQDPRLQVQQAGLMQDIFSFPGVGLPGFLGGGGGGAVMPIQPTTSVVTRFPRTVSFTTTTAAGNPKVITYRNMGACLLFSGDLSAAKRVRRIASKARRRVGGR